MGILAVCQWLQSTGWATAVRESLYIYPILYTLHIFGFVVLVTATSALDLRMLGWGLREWSVSRVAKLTLPWAKAGLTANVMTGFVVFSSNAVSMYNNTAFRVKMLLVLTAGLNILVFRRTTFRRVGEWGERGATPRAAKLMAGISLIVWFGIVAMSRVIGFTVP
jgi:hypothetical protein